MSTTNLLIKFNHYANIKQPEYIKHNDAFVIQSPVNLKLQPRCDAWIDLDLILNKTYQIYTIFG